MNGYSDKPMIAKNNAITIPSTVAIPANTTTQPWASSEMDRTIVIIIHRAMLGDGDATVIPFASSLPRISICVLQYVINGTNYPLPNKMWWQK